MKKSEMLAVDADHRDLDLPDWSGMDDSAARITPEAAFRLCERYPALLRQAGPGQLKDGREKCLVEFVL